MNYEDRSNTQKKKRKEKELNLEDLIKGQEKPVDL